MANFNTHLSQAEIATALSNGLSAASQSDFTILDNTVQVCKQALAYVIDSGAKNIINSSATTQTITDVTFTRNADDSWTTTASGNVAARRTKPITFTVPESFISGRYILTGCPAGGKVGNTVKYALYLFDVTANARVTANNDDTGEGFVFDWTPNTSHTYCVYIDIRSGTNPNGLVWKPMICLEALWTASNKFVKYVPSNAELYAMIQAL